MRTSMNHHGQVLITIERTEYPGVPIATWEYPPLLDGTLPNGKEEVQG